MPESATRPEVVPELENTDARDRGEVAVIRNERGAPGPECHGELDGVGCLDGNSRAQVRGRPQKRPVQLHEAETAAA